MPSAQIKNIVSAMERRGWREVSLAEVAPVYYELRADGLQLDDTMQARAYPMYQLRIFVMETLDNSADDDALLDAQRAIYPVVVNQIGVQLVSTQVQTDISSDTREDSVSVIWRFYDRRDVIS